MVFLICLIFLTFPLLYFFYFHKKSNIKPKHTISDTIGGSNQTSTFTHGTVSVEERLLAALEETTNPHDKCEIYLKLVQEYLHKYKIAEAGYYNNLCLTTARQLDFKKCIGHAQNYLSFIEDFKFNTIKGKITSVLEPYMENLKLMRETNNVRGQVIVCSKLGFIYYLMAKQMVEDNFGSFNEDVKEILKKAIEYYREMRYLGDRKDQEEACYRLSRLYFLLGDFPATIEHHQERFRIAQEFDDEAD